MIIDTWALDTLTIAVSYLSVMAGTNLLLDTFLSNMKWARLATALPSALGAIKIKAKDESDV